MTLRKRIRDIQRAVGVAADGIFGPVTAGAVYAALSGEGAGSGDGFAEDTGSGCGSAEDTGGTPALLDPRTAANLATLDEKARPAFEKFARLAAATAATMGCDYKAICGMRTWSEQEALYAKGRTARGPRVTDARAGQSWHNYGVAADFGVFRGRAYLDADDPGLAERVHNACAAHAEACGLKWGGDWGWDAPHYQLASLPSSPLDSHRRAYKERGTVL